MEFSIINLIQAMLAPGIMISACGLLILGMNNKYSLVVNRIRLLDDEKRKMKAIISERNYTNIEHSRTHSINIQLLKFNFRLKLVRNAVVSYSLAVAMFIIASLFIGLKMAFENQKLEVIVVLFFLTGMLLVLAGVLFAQKIDDEGLP